jgi:hypothetical protein
MTEKSILQNVFVALIFVCLTANTAFAQTTTFTYQGKLTDSGTPQTTYQMEFKLFGSAGGADQIGATITNTNISVNQGVFTVNLDFGAAAFPGADRFLQISVRRSASESFITLNPRQQITSSPYSIRTLSAAQADVALDSQKLGGVEASEYVTTSSVGNSFIKNSTTQQTGANFNIDGNGIVGGSVGIGVAPFAGVKLDVNGDTVIRTSGSGGNIQFGTPSAETGMTIVGTNRADVRFDGSILKLLAGLGRNVPPATNGININTLGNVGVGTAAPTTKLTVQSPLGSYGITNTTGAVTIGTYLGGSSSGAAGGWLGTLSNDSLYFFTNSGQPNMTIAKTSGNVGIGTLSPATRLALSGGSSWTSAGWTGSLSMGNASALGWEANASGQR